MFTVAVISRKGEAGKQRSRAALPSLASGRVSPPRWWTSTHRVRPRRGPISASPIPPAVISGHTAQLPALLARGVVVAGLLLEEG